MLNFSPEDRIFQALSVPARRLLIENMRQGPSTVTELAAPLGISLAAVIQHIQVLVQAGLVRTEKTGRTRTCSIDPEGFERAREWLQRCGSVVTSHVNLAPFCTLFGTARSSGPSVQSSENLGGGKADMFAAYSRAFLTGGGQQCPSCEGPRTAKQTSRALVNRRHRLLAE